MYDDATSYAYDNTENEGSRFGAGTSKHMIWANLDTNIVSRKPKTKTVDVRELSGGPDHGRLAVWGWKPGKNGDSLNCTGFLAQRKLGDRRGVLQLALI